jgi:hypothetical protein
MRQAASLDPDSYKHEIKPRDNGLMTITQIDHPMAVRSLNEMHVPCACGRPLVGIETELIVDPLGYAVYYAGVCLECGRQRGIYMSAPVMPEAMKERARVARMEGEVRSMLVQVERCRATGADTTDDTDAAESREEVA